MRLSLLTFGAFLLFLAPGTASGQTPSPVCPVQGTLNPKLVCLIPQVYGPWGLEGGTLQNGTSVPPNQQDLLTAFGHAAHFGNSFLTTFTPINEALGSQLSQLPLASPSSGISFVYDPALKTFSPSTDESLGPILGERASTIGKGKIFVGFSFQYFNFSSIDGQNMGSIPVVLTHEALTPNNTNTFPCSNQTSLTSANGYAGDPCFVRDFIDTQNSINLVVHQYTVYVTYGLLRHLDVSAAIPILNVSMGVTSAATINPQSFVSPAGAPPALPGNVFHQFNSCTPSTAAQSTCNPNVAVGCTTQPCLTSTFSDSGRSTGIGDVVLRAKYEVYAGEKLGVAVGVDVRTPTGDAQNFLGSGAVGVKPFGVVSYRARVAPHVELGYEKNGSSVLAGTNIAPLASGAAGVESEDLPSRFLYILGADARLTSRLTAAFDIYGQRVFSNPELFSQPYQGLGSCSPPISNTNNCPTYTAGTTHSNVAGGYSDVNIDDASVGFKTRLVGRLVLTANALIKLNDAGLRTKAVPLVGLSYSF